MCTPRYRLVFATAVFLCCLIAPVDSAALAVRDPAWAGKFYPETREQLGRLIDHLIDAAARDPGTSGAYPGLRALIIPHAGYVYSGATAAYAALAIVRDRFDRVVLLGPDHRVGFRNASVTQASHWRTPLGVVPVGHIGPMLIDRQELFSMIAASDRQEHSLEVPLPFLQARLSRFELIPVVLGPCDAGRMAQALRPLLQDPRTLLVVSADLSHYLPYDSAVKRDRETLGRILALDANWSQDQDNRTCGRYPVGVLLELARNLHWRPALLHYSNSGDTAGEKDAVVGYGAVAFYGDPPHAKSNR